MNRQYLEYSPEVGAPTASSHHGQQPRLQNNPNVRWNTFQTITTQKNLFSSDGPCRRFTPPRMAGQSESLPALSSQQFHFLPATPHEPY